MGCADSKSTEVTEKIDKQNGRSARRVSPEIKPNVLPGPIPVRNGTTGIKRGYNMRAVESLHGPIGSVHEPQISTAVKTTRRVSTAEDDDTNKTVIKFTPAKGTGDSAEITITQSRASTAAIDKIDVNVTPGGEITFSITPTSAMRDDTPTNGKETPVVNPDMLPNDVLAHVADKLKDKSWYDALVHLGLSLDEIKAVENVLVAKACFNEWKKRGPFDDIDKLEILETVLDNYHLERVFGKYKGQERLSDKGLYCLCKNIRKEWYGIVTDLGLEANDVRNIQVQCHGLVILQLLKMWNRTSYDRDKKITNLLNLLYECKLNNLANDLKRQLYKPQPSDDNDNMDTE